MDIDVEVMESGGGGLIVIVKMGEGTVSGGVPKSVALIVNVDVPELVGVPITVPVLFSFRPAGRLPVPTVYVIGATPPLVTMVWL